MTDVLRIEPTPRCIVAPRISAIGQVYNPDTTAESSDLHIRVESDAGPETRNLYVAGAKRTDVIAAVHQATKRGKLITAWAHETTDLHPKTGQPWLTGRLEVAGSDGITVFGHLPAINAVCLPCLWSEFGRSGHEIILVSPKVMTVCAVHDEITGRPYVDLAIEVEGSEGRVAGNVLLHKASQAQSCAVVRQAFDQRIPLVIKVWRTLTEHPLTGRPWLQGEASLLGLGPEPVN